MTPVVLAMALAGAVMPAQAEPNSVSIELNKLEPRDKGCRAHFVVSNSSETALESMKLDLVLFQPDGVIGRRIIVDLAPIQPKKRAVKQFDLEDTPCDRIGSMLINEITECRAACGPLDDCLARIAVSSLTSVQVSK